MTETFSYPDLVDELSCWDACRLERRRAELVREQRRLHVRRVGGDRGARSGAARSATRPRPRMACRCGRCASRSTGEPTQGAPAVAAAAYAVRMSEEQLRPVDASSPTRTSDAEWAEKGGNVPPGELERLARNQVKPTSEAYAERHAARSLRTWWDEHKGVLQHPWSVRGGRRRDHRDAVEQVDRPHAPCERTAVGARVIYVARTRWSSCVATTPMSTPRCTVRRSRCSSVCVPQSGPAEIARRSVARLDRREPPRRRRTSNRSSPTTTACRSHAGRVSAALSNKIARAVRLRDGHCRWPGCDRRTGLQVHHLWPRSWGGTDDIANLAAVCVGGGTDHHQQLAPHGHLLLLGNPNQPDGLRLVTRDQLGQQANAPPNAAA